MIYNHILDLIFDDIFLKIDNFINIKNFFVKIEGFSIGGSIKIKPALKMIEYLENTGQLNKDSHIIESSSGNLGIALSIVCSAKGYKFTCVSDPNINKNAEKIMKAYGANVIKVTKKDKNGGYLATRINFIRNLLANNSYYVWTNQYENFCNVMAHYEYTAKAIYKEFGKNIDYLFIGAGTTGTLTGVSKFFKRYSPDTKIIAVDVIGSVTYSNYSSKRLIPGLGTSKKPPISKHAEFDEIIFISEEETIDIALDISCRNLLFGGSTYTVLAAVKKFEDHFSKNNIVVALSPDLGINYLDTLFNMDWIKENFNKGLK